MGSAGGEGSALPGLQRVGKFLGPWPGLSPPGLPAQLVDSCGLPGARGTDKGSLAAYPSPPAATLGATGEGEGADKNREPTVLPITAPVTHLLLYANPSPLGPDHRPSLQVRKLHLREVQSPAQGHTATKHREHL